MTIDPVHPWLDPAEVRRMAERLIRPGGQPPPDISDAGFDDAFIGFISPLPPPPVEPTDPEPAESISEVSEPQSATEVHEEPSQEAQPEPAATQPVTPASLPDPDSPRGPLLHRIQQFRDWLVRHFEITGVFILNRDGSCIYDDGAHSKLHFLARGLAFATRQPGSVTGNVHVKISAQSVLEVLPIDTPYGLWVLGVGVHQALSPSAVETLKHALAQVAAPPQPESHDE